MSKGSDRELPEVIAALLTCIGPVLRLVLIYFKLGKAEGCVGPWSPRPPWGGKRELIFYVDIFFSTLFSFSIWGPWGFLSSPHLVP